MTDPSDSTVADLVERTAAFVRREVLPLETEHRGLLPQDEQFRRTLQAAARSAGVFGPQISTSLGGHGLSMLDRSPVFEAAGYSLFGPLALNCAAPDEGNIHLLERVATPEQRDQFLEPLAHGDLRSSFAMTEPPPGAGSDPRALRTSARREGRAWILNGHKRFITGADGAGFLIVMARTSGEPGDRGGATMFLVDSANPGLTVGRHMDTVDQSMLGGHCELTFAECKVGEDAVLGEVNRGLDYAQVRLAPARMTHCMRWLGVAARAQDVAIDYARGRRVFGSPLAELGLAQGLLADSEIDLEVSRAMISRACDQLDRGAPAAQETSIAKTFVSEAVARVVDRAIQICGGMGMSHDLPLARLMNEVRPFRVYDGPSEVHRWRIARQITSDTSRGRWR